MFGDNGRRKGRGEFIFGRLDARHKRPEHLADDGHGILAPFLMLERLQASPCSALGSVGGYLGIVLGTPRLQPLMSS